MSLQECVAALHSAQANLEGGRLERARRNALQALELAMPHADLELGRSLQPSEELWYQIGHTLKALSELPGCRTAWLQRVALCEKFLPPDHPELQSARADLAEALAALGELAESRRLEEQVLEVRARTLPAEHSDLQRAQMNLAATLSDLGHLCEARQLYEQVLQVRARTLPAEHPDLQRAQMNLAATLRDLGHLCEARQLYEQVLQVRARTLPAEHPDLQDARERLATTLANLKQWSEARHLLEQALQVRSHILPDEHPDLLRTKRLLARTLSALRDFASARRLEEQVLEVFDRILPAGHEKLHAARADLVSTLFQLGDLAAACSLQEQVLHVCVSTLPADHPNLQRAREKLATILAYLKDWAVARSLLEQVLQVRSRILPDEHPDLQITRRLLAQTLFNLGDFAGARRLWEQVLEVLGRILPEDHQDLNALRAELAKTLARNGDFKEACQLQEQVIELLGSRLPADHEELHVMQFALASMLNDGAAKQCEIGDLAGARQMQEQVLEILGRILPVEHPDLQTARANLAATLAQLGDLAGARRLQELVLEVRGRILPAEHQDLHAARVSLGATLGMLGDLDGSARLQGQALDSVGSNLWATLPHVLALANVAANGAQRGELHEARQLQEHVVTSLSAMLPAGHADLLAARANLALIMFELGDLVGARQLQESVKEALGGLMPAEHPHMQGALAHLALTLAAQGETHSAYSHTLAAFRGLRFRVAYLGATAGLEVLDQLAGTFCKAVGQLLSLSHIVEGDASAEIDLLGLQCISIDLHRQRIHQLRKLEDGDVAIRESLNKARIENAHFHELLNLTAAPPEQLQRALGSTDESNIRAELQVRLKSARENMVAANQALSRLAAQRGVYGLDQVWPDNAVQMLQVALPEATTFVLTAHYHHMDFATRLTEPRVATYLVGSSTVQRIDLGPAALIDELAETLRLLLDGRQAVGATPVSDPGAALMHVLKPLFAAVPPTTRRLWVCPDGPLASIPWDALPSEATTLGDSYEIDYFATPSQALPLPRGALAQPSLLCFGGIDFGSADPSAESNEGADDYRAAPRDGNQTYKALPGSDAEVRRVSLRFRNRFPGAPALLCERSHATRAAFVNTCVGKRFIHLATHAGFGIPGDWALTETGDCKVDRAIRTGMLDRDLLSWIVFAGANRIDSVERARSLLSASEIKGLDLTGCELVVASACETNLGARFFGESISGINRALQLAGAHYSITSLWRVSDAGALLFFSTFYGLLWGEQGCTVPNAFRQARNRLRAQGLPPSVWAAFVLYGGTPVG